MPPIPPADGAWLPDLKTLTFWPGAPYTIAAELRRTGAETMPLYGVFGVLERVIVSESRTGERVTLRGLFAGSRGNLFLPMFRARKLYPPDQAFTLLRDTFARSGRLMFAFQVNAQANTSTRGFDYQCHCRVLEAFDELNLLSQSLRGIHVNT